MNTMLISLAEFMNKLENGNLHCKCPQNYFYCLALGLLDARNGYLTQHILSYDELSKIMDMENVKLRQHGKKLAFVIKDAYKPG